MARPPLPLGHHGNIKASRSGTRLVARCRYRGYDGVTRKLERWGSTRTAARTSLQDELRQHRGERTVSLRPGSRFREAADVWLAKTKERREDSTVDTYRFWLDKVVLPGLGELCLVECDVAHLDAWFGRLAAERRTVEHRDGMTTEKSLYAANSRRTIRTIVSGVLQQAVLHKAIPTNPVRELERIESPKEHKKATARGLTAEERQKLLGHVDTDSEAVAADLPDIIRFGIGTGLRIGEICAVRWMDVNLDGLVVGDGDSMRLVPVLAVRQNVYPVAGKGLIVHGGKSPRALRIVPLPQFVVQRLRARRLGDEPPEMPVFASAGRDGRPTYRWPSTLRRRVRVERAKDQTSSAPAPRGSRRCGSCYPTAPPPPGRARTRQPRQSRTARSPLGPPQRASRAGLAPPPAPPRHLDFSPTASTPMHSTTAQRSRGSVGTQRITRTGKEGLVQARLMIHSPLRTQGLSLARHRSLATVGTYVRIHEAWADNAATMLGL